jgi:hypothetical protein
MESARGGETSHRFDHAQDPMGPDVIGRPQERPARERSLAGRSYPRWAVPRVQPLHEIATNAYRAWDVGQIGGDIMAGSTVRFESRILIQRPIGMVFERLADIPGYGRWMRRTGLFRRAGLTAEGPVRQGTATSTRPGWARSTAR